ncbi:flagellar biosynthesis protein FliR [Planctomycetes bacterium MalM25]|nr:flagellar biosynthesis protein FliR [Planctomycetes bacterium MalM25]
MAGLENQLTELGVMFTLVLARVGAMVGTAPLLSDGSLPRRVKALIAVAIAAVITPMAMAHSGGELPSIDTLLVLGALAGSEIIIGLALGLGLTIVIAGVQLTGQVVGQMSGMALAEGSDPVFGDTASVFGQVYYLVTMAVFVAAGGMNHLVGGLLDTFQIAPPGSGYALDALIEGFIGLLGLGFEMGVRAAAPLMLALFVATLVLGLVSRTLPQINTMVVGFGINAMLLLGVMSASLGAVAYAYQAPLSSVIDSIVLSIDAPPIEDSLLNVTPATGG